MTAYLVTMTIAAVIALALTCRDNADLHRRLAEARAEIDEERARYDVLVEELDKQHNMLRALAESLAEGDDGK